MEFKFEFDEKAALARLNLESGGKVQYALDSAIVRTTDPYVPMDTGTLAQTVRGVGTGRIEYIQPYARYQYYGMAMLAPNGSAYAQLGETKHLSGEVLHYNKEKHPLAGAFWFERSKAENLDSWIAEAKKAVG